MADHCVAGVAAGATGSHFEKNDLDKEERSQPEKQQVSVAAETLSSSHFTVTLGRKC